MPKSKYPDKLDTSVEIPVVRDNITEIGSDVLNSLRSAIFNIEKALGINPQGAIGNTVAARLSNSLDENGNILKEALDRSNVLSGPVTDADVSKVAAINESKLRLNFPTDLLQDQISILNNKLATFIITLEDLNAILSAHIHSDAINRHYAQAITTIEAEVNASEVATMSLEEGTLQDILEEIYNSHINYAGADISAENNSHSASQIYYDNEETSDFISSESVQGAIDDLSAADSAAWMNSNLNFNSNGIIRTGSSYDAFENFDIGSELVEASEITYTGPYGTSTLRISFPDDPTPTSIPKMFDILTIIDAPDEADNDNYVISNVGLTAEDNLSYVTVFGGPKHALTEGTTAKITKSAFNNYNENGLNCSVRPRYLHSNTPDIQVALPNAATVISSGIKPTSLVADSVDTIGIEIDGGSAIDIPVFDEDFDMQSVDMVVNMINQYAVANKLNIFAYKIRSLRCFELAITHILPNFEGDLKNRTLKLVAPSENDATEALGLSYLLDREVEGTEGNAFHINGRLLEDFGNIKTYTSDTIFINTGTMTMDSIGVDFIEDGIRIGDLCVIEGSSESGDDGTHRVLEVDTDLLTLDSVGARLLGEISEDAVVYIIRCTAPIGEMEFESVGDGMIMFDVFVDHNKDVFYKKRMDIVGHLVSGDFVGIVSDVSSWFLKSDDEYTLTVGTDGMAALAADGVSGESIFVGTTGAYKVPSSDGMAYVVLDVVATGNPDSSIMTTLTGSDPVPSSVLHLCRGIYSTKFGFVLGPELSYTGGGVPRVIDKRATGTVDDTIISESFLERYIQGPRNDLRSSGVIRAANIDSVTDNVTDQTCEITINPGIVIVNGVRFEYLGVAGLVYKYNDDIPRFYVALDGNGCIVIGDEVDPEEGSDYVSPFIDRDVAYLAYVTIDTGEDPDTIITDLRLFVDHIDHKLLGDITVATDQRFGHFTDIQSAVNYARVFSKMFPDMGTPNVFIKEGVHNVSETILIDFDLVISGSGPNTVIQRSGTLLSAAGSAHGGSSTWALESSVFLVGSATDVYDFNTFYGASSDDIVNGVTFKDFTYRQPEGTDSDAIQGTVINIIQEINDDPSSEAYANAMFRILNINFVGVGRGAAADTVEGVSGTWDVPYEFAIRIGYGEGLDEYYGNLMVKDCYFSFMGFGDGAIYLDRECVFNNIIITNNISMNTSYSSSQIPASTSGYDFGIISNECLYDDISELNGVIETGNISDDQY